MQQQNGYTIDARIKVLKTRVETVNWSLVVLYFHAFPPFISINHTSNKNLEKKGLQQHLVAVFVFTFTCTFNCGYYSAKRFNLHRH